MQSTLLQEELSIAEVAIKLIYAAGEGSFTQSDKKKLSREAAALAKVSSPHVVGLRGQTVVTDFVCCLVMEHLDGKSLDKLLEQAGAGIPAMNEATALSCLPLPMAKQSAQLDLPVLQIQGAFWLATLFPYRSVTPRQPYYCDH